MKTVLVLSEAKYWHDLKTGLAQAGVLFLGFDKKKPNRKEIDELVAKSDFVVMRNQNVAHHSVRFAKEACKMTDTPFWINSSFGLETILKKLAEQFPQDHFSTSPVKNTVKTKKNIADRTVRTPLTQTAHPTETQQYLKNKKKNLPLKKALSQVKIDDDDIDFAQLFKK
jgi:hypothetical protein